MGPLKSIQSGVFTVSFSLKTPPSRGDVTVTVMGLVDKRLANACCFWLGKCTSP